MQSSSIRRLPATRPALLAFEVTDKITSTDVEWMADQVQRAFDTLDEVDILILMTDYEGIEFGAAFDLKSFKVQARANRHVRRYAVVGAPTWVETMIEMFSLFTPVDTKTFDLDEADHAWTWVGGR